jgi:hypothetical protein
MTQLLFGSAGLGSLAFPECSWDLPCVGSSVQAPSDRAVPKLRPSSPRMSTIGRASLATRLVAERLPGPHVRPSTDITSWCPLLHRDRGLDAGPTVPLVALVPSSWFLTTSTVSSTTGLASLLHLAADHGVHRVSPPRRRMPAALPTPPLQCTCPPERFLPQQPYACHHTPLPPCRSPPSWEGGATSRPCSAG